jgi:hypothetical protein
MSYQYDTYLHHNNYSYENIDNGNHSDDGYDK